MRLLSKTDDPDFLLRLALRANAIFSTLCAFVWIVGGESLGQWFGHDGSMAADGVGLLVFATLVAALSLQGHIHHGLAGAVVALDVLWALNAFAEIASGTFSTAGAWIMGLIALAVVDFAALQALGIRRARGLRDNGTDEASLSA